jgi:Family of unknown function (DUF6209)
MIERCFAGKPPRVTFTLDFHELVRGDLVPGIGVMLRYDPKRIVPAGEPYLFGDPDRPVIAHVMFRPDNRPVSKALISPSGPRENPDVDITGGGDMLTGLVDVPPDAQEVMIWFTYASPVSGLQYDSDNGYNYHFGFPSRQIAVLSATVGGDSQESCGRFELRVAAVEEAQRVAVRLRIVGNAEFGKADLDLARTGDLDGKGWPIWETGGIAVPSGAVVQFKLFYWIAGIGYKDDNSGIYYMAPQPELEQVPPPPARLGQAAERWLMS